MLNIDYIVVVFGDVDVSTSVKCAIRDEKSSHCYPNKDQKFKKPESGKKTNMYKCTVRIEETHKKHRQISLHPCSGV